LVKIAFMYQI